VNEELQFQLLKILKLPSNLTSTKSGKKAKKKQTKNNLYKMIIKERTVHTGSEASWIIIPFMV